MRREEKLSGRPHASQARGTESKSEQSADDDSSRKSRSRHRCVGSPVKPQPQGCKLSDDRKSTLSRLKGFLAGREETPQVVVRWVGGPS